MCVSVYLSSRNSAGICSAASCFLAQRRSREKGKLGSRQKTREVKGRQKRMKNNAKAGNVKKGKDEYRGERKRQRMRKHEGFEGI